MPKLIDLTGQRFGKLVVIKRTEDKIYSGQRSSVQYLCECDCGNSVKVTANSLRSKNAKSCGCYRREIAEKHKQARTRLYKIWGGMKQRCNNEKNSHYDTYGGKGISVCSEWNEFENFYKWATENGYADTLTIDRINCDGNYEPSNCRWITIKEQQNNRSSNHLITYNGKTQTMKQWAEELGMKYVTLVSRINRNKWEVEKALTTPVGKWVKQ